MRAWWDCFSKSYPGAIAIVAVLAFCIGYLAGPAKAELRIDVSPAAVTAPDRGVVVLEASSLHWMVNILYEDVAEKRSVHVGYASGLLSDAGETSSLFGARFATSSSESPEYINDKTRSLLNIANGVRTRSYALTEQLGRSFPTPTVQYTVRINPDDARALRFILKRLHESWGERLGVQGYNASGRIAFQTALDHTRLRQLSSGQILPWETSGVFQVEGVTPNDQRGIPGLDERPFVPVVDVDGEAHATPLAYLYAAMLTSERDYSAARVGDALQGKGTLAGCTFPDKFSVREENLISGDLAGIVQGLADGSRRGDAVAPYQVLMKRAETFDNDVNAFLRFAASRISGNPNPAADIEASLRLGDILLDGQALLKQSLWEHPLVVEAMILGHVDPAVIPIWRCMALRAGRGIVEPFDSTVARNVAYDEIDRSLMSKQWSALVGGRPTDLTSGGTDTGSPRFFAAAHNVTRLLGVGLVDAIELYPSVEMLTAELGSLPFDTNCAGWTDSVPDIFPKASERDFLREVNFDLFRNINLTVVRELNRTNVLFDPVDWSPLNASSPADADFEFDLRMVLVEQGRIEDFMNAPGIKEKFGLDQPDAYDRLTNSQLALYCSVAAKLARGFNSDPESQFQVIGKLDEFLKTLKDEKVIDATDAGFENYRWRVAAGSAYVHALHGKSKSDFVAYMQKLVRETTQAIEPTDDFPAYYARELKAITNFPTEPDADLVDDWTEGLSVYLVASDAFGKMTLFDCEVNDPSQRLVRRHFAGTLEPREVRIKALLKEGSTDARKLGGLAPILYAFELTTSGRGALLPDAALEPEAQGTVAACKDIEDKQTALEELMTSGNPMDFLYTAEDKNFLVMERSQRMSTTLSTLEPFLINRLKAWANGTVVAESKTRQDMRALVRQSLVEALTYSRNHALLGRLPDMGRKRPAVLTAIGVTETPDQLKAKFDALALAASPCEEYDPGSEALRECNQGATAAIGIADALELRMKRVSEGASVLQTYHDKVCAALDGCSATEVRQNNGSPATKLKTIPIPYTYPNSSQADILKGLSSQSEVAGSFGLTPDASDASSALAGSNFFYRTTPTGATTAAGDPIYEAELIYRFPLPESIASVTSAVPDERAAEAATQTLDGIDGLQKHRDFPLGIVFTSTTRDPVTEAVSLVDQNRRDVVLKTGEFAQAAKGLGVPGFVEILGISVGDDPTPMNLTVFVTTRILGEPLGTALEIPLIENGKFGDPGASLREALTTVIDARARGFVAAAAERLGAGRLPEDADDFENATVRFGPGSRDALSVDLDWESKTLAARLGYVLEVGDTTFAAEARVLVTDTGNISLQSVEFDHTDIDLVPALRTINEIDTAFSALETLAADLLTAQREIEIDDIEQSFQTYPVVRASQVALSINHGFVLTIGSTRCAISIRTEARLDPDDLFEAASEAISNGIVSQVADCTVQAAVTPLAKTLSEFSSTPEFSLFGTKAKISLGEDGGMSEPAAASLIQGNGGNLPILLELDQSELFCESGYSGSVRGGALRFNDAKTSAELDLGGIEGRDAENLSLAVGCQVSSFLPEAIKSFVEIDGVSFLGGAVFVDATIRGLPILSDVQLQRINLTNPEAGADAIKRIIEDSAVAALGAQLSEALRALFKDGTIDIAGIGQYKFGATRLINAGSPWWVEMDGTLSVQGFDFPDTQIRLPIGGSLSDIDVRVADAEDVILGQLGQVLLQLLPVVPEAPQVQNLFFGKLNPQGTLYGFRFGLKAGFPLGGNSINFELHDAELSLQGLTLGDEITIGIPTPLYFGPVALSQVLMTIVTGERKGLKIGADLTAVEPQLARVLKLRSVLDLSNIERLAFSLRSDVIALDTVNLMFAEGKLDLSRAYARFDAGAADLIKDIIDPQLRGELNGETGLVYAESKMDVLGVELQRNAMQLCSRDCEVGGTPGAATLDVAQRMLLGQARGGARMDLAFRSPGVGAGIDLDLFGWNPGGADFALNLSGAETSLRFLGMEVTILTPTYQTMDPGFVARVLKDLLKIDLSNLLEVDMKEITISLMSPSGGVSTAKPAQSDGNSGGGNQSGTEGREATGAEDNQAHNEAAAAAEAGPAQDDDAPQDPARTAPKQETWGVQVAARVCERWTGPDTTDGIKSEFNHFYFIYAFPGFYGQEAWKAWRWKPWAGDLPDWFTWPSLAGPAASQICKSSSSTVGRWFEIEPNIVSIGAARQRIWGGAKCNEDGSARINIRPLPGKTEKERSLFQRAGLPLLCFDTGSRTIRVDSTLYHDNTNNQFLLVPRCPATTVDRFDVVRESRAFRKLCRNKSEPIIAIPMTDTDLDFRDGVTTITARQELALYQRVILPKIFGRGEDGKKIGTWPLDTENFRLEPNEILMGGKLVQVAFIEEMGGEDTRIATNKLEATTATGDANPLFELYLRAKAADDWRPIFLKVYLDYRRNGNILPEFITEDIRSASSIVLRAPELDRPHSLALKWYWPDADGVNERISLIPSRIPTLDGDIRVGPKTQKSLIQQQRTMVEASADGSAPFRLALGLSTAQELQFRLQFQDAECALQVAENPAGCGSQISHLPDNNSIRFEIVPRSGSRVKLDVWSDPSPVGSVTKCIQVSTLRSQLGTELGVTATNEDVSDLFFELDDFSQRTRNFNSRPEVALLAAGDC